MTDFRIEKDSLGEVKVPKDALYSAQTQRAVENFPVSGIGFSRAFLRALGLIKATAAEVNAGLGSARCHDRPCNSSRCSRSV